MRTSTSIEQSDAPARPEFGNPSRLAQMPVGMLLLGWLWLGVANAQAQFFPDLIVTEIEISPTNPAPGQNIAVTVHAVNIGNAIPEPETFMYLYHNTASPVECNFDQVEPLGVAFPPETERLFNFTVSYPTAGSYELWAWVDACENLIDEGGLAGESNNTLSRVINVGLGDLTIESIATSVADPVPGQPVFVDVRIRNSGPALVDQIWYVGVFRQQAEPMTCAYEQSQGPFQGFAANSTVTRQFGPFTYQAGGEYPIWAWVDCANTAVEADDNNNKLLGTITISRPNLVVESITPSVATPSANAPFDVDVTVRNVGSAPAGAFRVSIEPDNPSFPQNGCPWPAFQEVAGGLAVNASTTLQFNLTYADSRQHSFWAFADSCEAVNETIESDNVSGIYINVGNPAVGTPDLVVERIDVSEVSTPEYGGVSVFDVTVRNVGPASAGSFRVGDFAPPNFPGTFPSAVVIGSPGPANGGGGVVSVGPLWNDCEWRSREVPGGLASGASVTVQFWRGFYQTGAYAFTAYADVCGSNATYQTVFESSETNNGLTIEFEAVGCDADSDGDGICDADDLCPSTPDPLNNDSDGDGIGDACDDDDDNDGVLDVDDCEPRNPFIFPGNVENCTDGIDNNCDGQIDEGAVEWYRDSDGDGFGDPADVAMDCTQPEGYIGQAGDCDDANAAVYPGANGPCDDGLDNDCDGTVDNEMPVWGRDADADGFTDPNDEIVDDDGVCDGQPEGYILASAVPDPDDDDFMNPEPVRPEPERIDISTPQGNSNSATLALRRNGPEPFSFDTVVSYGPQASGWLAVDPAGGDAENGTVTLRLTPNVAGLNLASYEATLSVSINGLPEFDVPVSLTVRDPILRVVHTGQGGGRVWTEYFDNARNRSVYLGNFDTEEGTFVLETEVPFGEGVYLYDSEDECSIANGFYLDGAPLPEDPEEGRVGPVLIDMDTTIEADFAPNYLLCSSCGVILMLVSVIGMNLARRRL